MMVIIKHLLFLLSTVIPTFSPLCNLLWRYCAATTEGECMKDSETEREEGPTSSPPPLHLLLHLRSSEKKELKPYAIVLYETKSSRARGTRGDVGGEGMGSGERRGEIKPGRVQIVDATPVFSLLSPFAISCPRRGGEQMWRTHCDPPPPPSLLKRLIRILGKI